MKKFAINAYPRTQIANTIIQRDKGNLYLFDLEQIKETPFYDHIDDVSVFAQMSALTYVSNLNVCKKTDKEKLAKSAAQWETNITAAGWQILSWDESIPKDGYSIKTLKFDIWIDSKNDRAVIAFRGTAKLADWWSNARWVTRFVPKVNDHYNLVEFMLVDVIAKLTEVLGKNFKLYTTGHSLGGGLAQYFAYATSHPVEFVCAFHTTPVTGYYTIDPERRVKSEKGLYIARLYEHGEVLAYMRLMLQKLYKVSTSNPRISEFRTNFIKGGFITQHSIAAFADEYRKLSKQQ